MASHLLLPVFSLMEMAGKSHMPSAEIPWKFGSLLAHGVVQKNVGMSSFCPKTLRSSPTLQAGNVAWNIFWKRDMGIWISISKMTPSAWV